VNVLLVRVLFPGSGDPVTVPYTLFKVEAARGNVERVYSRGESLTGRFRSPVIYPPPSAPDAGGEGAPGAGVARREAGAAASREVTDFATTIPVFVDPGLEELLIANGTEISAEPIQEGNPWLQLLFSFGPALILIALYVWFYRRLARQGGPAGMLGSMGKSGARRFDQDSSRRVTFDDVAGIDDAENELVEIVDFLKNPEKYTRLGARAPKGVLLVGPPGTGKTLLARAVAGEAGVPFFSMSGSEFVEMIVGVGAARVRDLFKQARENAPAIIFIDEIDSIGRARGQWAIGGASEQEQTLNQILHEMDGFTGSEGVIVLAATNQPDVLDRAPLRAGRFDRRVIVNLPDRAGRKAILEVHTRRVPLDPDVDLDELAQATPGFSRADLRNLVNEAALLAARREHEKVRQADFLDALEKIMLGPERPILLGPEIREQIAYHEAGHAILGFVVPGAHPVQRVTIVPRGQALGVTYQRPDSDRYNYPEEYLRARIIGVLGGRAAEELVFGTRATGAQNDIEQAMHIARSMVTRWGMSDRLGMVQLAPRENPYLGTVDAYAPRPYSEATAAAVDAEVQRLIQECHDEARRLLHEHRAALDALTQALLEWETLDEEEILEVTGLGRPVESEREQAAAKATVDAAGASAPERAVSDEEGEEARVCAFAGATPSRRLSQFATDRQAGRRLSFPMSDRPASGGLMRYAGLPGEPMTAEQLYTLPDTTADRLELVRGSLVREPPATPEHGGLAVRLGARLHAFVDRTALGFMTSDVGFVLATDPDTVRAPDLAFVARERIPTPDATGAYWALAPDLAVEILSSSNTASEVQEKILDYLDAGSRMVWVLDPRRRTVTVYRSRHDIRILGGGEELTGDDVLPGFAVGVDEVFG
jgi:cell division protease FtsH